MTQTVVGLDIGGANLKLAWRDSPGHGSARSVSFALWKQPDTLAAILAPQLAELPDAPIALTLTGELCDCFVTKREGVERIVQATQQAAPGRLLAIWGTDGQFHAPESAMAQPHRVAAANWHALATYLGPRYAPHHGALLLDVGSTTCDLIPLEHGVPAAVGATDEERLQTGELCYQGASRTPLCALVPAGWPVMAEFFATFHDVTTILGLVAEDPQDHDTANGRGRTVDESLGRIARMLGGDRETIAEDRLIAYAVATHGEWMARLSAQIGRVWYGPPDRPELRTLILSGAGEALARRAAEVALAGAPRTVTISLQDELGPERSQAAPAWAVAELWSEQNGL
jgi:hypothetical protein